MCKNFVYSFDGYGYCVPCVTGESDVPYESGDNYIAVPSDEAETMVCENCGATGESRTYTIYSHGRRFYAFSEVEARFIQDTVGGYIESE